VFIARDSYAISEHKNVDYAVLFNLNI